MIGNEVKKAEEFDKKYAKNGMTIGEYERFRKR